MAAGLHRFSTDDAAQASVPQLKVLAPDQLTAQTVQQYTVLVVCGVLPTSERAVQLSRLCGAQTRFVVADTVGVTGCIFVDAKSGVHRAPAPLQRRVKIIDADADTLRLHEHDSLARFGRMSVALCSADGALSCNAVVEALDGAGHVIRVIERDGDKMLTAFKDGFLHAKPLTTAYNHVRFFNSLFFVCVLLIFKLSFKKVPLQESLEQAKKLLCPPGISRRDADSCLAWTAAVAVGAFYNQYHRYPTVSHERRRGSGEKRVSILCFVFFL